MGREEQRRLDASAKMIAMPLTKKHAQQVGDHYNDDDSVSSTTGSDGQEDTEFFLKRLDGDFARHVGERYGEGRVEALDLRGTGVQSIEGNLESLSRLKRLVLADNHLDVMGGLSDLSCLTELDVANNKM